MTLISRRAAIVAGIATCVQAPMASADIPRVFRVPSDSMAPTVIRGDYVLATPILSASDIRFGDLVAFRIPDEEIATIKRVIGRAGQTISFRDGLPTLDGAAAVWTPQTSADHSTMRFEERLGDHTYSIELTPQMAVDEARNVAETIVPAEHFYLVGDSRDRSYDSRIFGPVRGSDITHKAIRIVRSDDPTRVDRSLE